MADNATFRLDGSVLVDEGSCLVRVALEADLVLGSGGAQLFREKATVLVVAGRALNQPLIHPVAEGFGEIRFHLAVAAIAKQGLLFDQQVLLLLGVVG